MYKIHLQSYNKSLDFFYYCVETRLNTFAKLLYFIITLGMKLTNKLIAGFTAVAVVVAQFGLVVPALTVKADNAENMMAYDWAFDS